MLLFPAYVGRKSVQETSGVEPTEAVRPEKEHMKE